MGARALNTRGWIILAAFILLPLVLLWGTWRILQAIAGAIRTPEWVKVNRQKRYAQLLIRNATCYKTYKTGKDNFEVSLETSELRIFKQLEDEGFIHVHPAYVYYANMPVNCSLTPECSKALRQIHNLA